MEGRKGATRAQGVPRVFWWGSNAVADEPVHRGHPRRPHVPVRAHAHAARVFACMRMRSCVRARDVRVSACVRECACVRPSSKATKTKHLRRTLSTRLAQVQRAHAILCALTRGTVGTHAGYSEYSHGRAYPFHETCTGAARAAKISGRAPNVYLQRAVSTLSIHLARASHRESDDGPSRNIRRERRQ